MLPTTRNASGSPARYLSGIAMNSRIRNDEPSIIASSRSCLSDFIATPFQLNLRNDLQSSRSLECTPGPGPGMQGGPYRRDAYHAAVIAFVSKLLKSLLLLLCFWF